MQVGMRGTCDHSHVPQRAWCVHDLVEAVASTRPNHTALFIVRPSARRHAEGRSQGNDAKPVDSSQELMASTCRDLAPGDQEGDRDCADDGSESYTFHQINVAANNAAEKLRSIWRKRHLSPGKEVGERAVVLLVDEGVGLAVAELAVLKSEAAFVPVDPVWPPERIAFIIKDCAASAVIVSKAGADDCIRKMTSAGLAVGEDVDGGMIPVVVIEHAMGPMEDSSHSSEQPAALIPASASSSDPTSSPPAHAANRDRTPCHIIYTSGSTGQPKGVVCEHRSLVSYVAAKAQAHGIDHTSRVLVAAASTWDPSVGDLFCALSQGATACMAPRAALVEELPAVVQASRATHLSTTPALWAMLPPDMDPSSFPHLAVLALGGERMPDTVVHKWGSGSNGLKLLNTYGVTEATVYQTVHHVTPKDPDILAGRPLNGVEIAIEGDPDMGGGIAGEILIGGVQCARGYLNQPELTTSKFFTAADGTRWFRSGDLGEWVVGSAASSPGSGSGSGAALRVLGRMDLQVKLRGFRIELEEVEAVIKQCPLVRNAAVQLHATMRDESLAAPRSSSIDVDPPSSSSSSSWSSRLVAFVEFASGQKSFEEGGEIALRLHCQRKMPAFQVPAQLVCVPSLPISSSGKLDRQALPSPPPITSRGSAALGLAGSESLEGPRTLALQKAVGSVWESVLGVEKVGRWDHFWDLGGNSILAVRMLNQLEQKIGDALVPATTGRWASTREDRARVRLCGLHRKPRLKDFVRFLEWAAVTAPNAVEAEGGAGRDDGEARKQGDVEREEGAEERGGNEEPRAGKREGGRESAEDVLGRLDAEEGVAEDERDVERAAMTLAARGGHAPVLRCLLQQGASPEGWAVHDHSPSPLMLAAGAGHAEAVHVLVAAHASLRPVDSLHTNALMLAAAGGHVGIIQLLLSPGVGAPRDARTLNKWSAVHHASFHGHVPAIHALAQHGASLNLKDRWSRTPLAWAVFNGHLEAAEYLIGAGGRLLEGGEHGRNQPQLARQRRLGNRWSPAIMLAVQAVLRSNRTGDGPHGPFGVLDLLLAHRDTLAIKIDAIDADGRTALHQACMDQADGPNLTDGSELGQDTDMPGPVSNDTATALVGNASDTRESLVEQTPPSSESKTEAVVQRILTAGASVNVRDLSGVTPLHCAAAAANVRTVDLLLQAGADAMARDKQGRTALDLVEGEGRDKAVCRARLQNAMPALIGQVDDASVNGGVSGLNLRADCEQPSEGGWVEAQNRLMGAAFFMHAKASKASR